MLYNILAFLFVAVIAALWRAGGGGLFKINGDFKMKWSGFRDVLVPVLLSLWYTFTGNWILGTLVGGFANTIRIGYGAYDPEHDDKPSWLAKITKDREGWKIRMIYGAITSFAIGLAPAIHNAFFVYNTFVWQELGRFGAYIVLNILVEFAMNKLKANVWWTECGNGAARATVVFLCR